MNLGLCIIFFLSEKYKISKEPTIFVFLPYIFYKKSMRIEMALERRL